MKQIVTCLLVVQKFTNLKQKILTLQQPIMFRKYSKDWSIDNVKKTGFMFMIYVYVYFYDFSVDYDPVTFNNIKDIHNNLMETNNIV